MVDLGSDLPVCGKPMVTLRQAKQRSDSCINVTSSSSSVPLQTLSQATILTERHIIMRRVNSGNLIFAAIALTSRDAILLLGGRCMM